MTSTVRRAASALILASCVLTLSALAGTITQTTVRAGNDYIDWSQLPPPITVINGPAAVVSNGGLHATVSNAAGSFFTDQQGNPWLGNFAPDDFLIGSGQITMTGNMLITFAKPVFSIGAQMGMDLVSSTPVPFTENLVLFDSSNHMLAALTAQGYMDDHADNSAVWIGASDTVAEIASAEFFITNGSGLFPDAYALNRVSITTVPEPSSLMLLGSGVVALLRLRRKVPG